ncbi:hypothetical protein KPL78_13110 [Roseomonas sp. HJA6]|uniref:Transcriptional regulator TetR C-terminal Proteobacteria type domain-containing protein n=1 Tax=Roseomonas alba TaxID=2846776 RepID=A0ABS7A943_9PROT|nr:hypothetical protein [Neoroseomonas alba]MBW6398796.1 hypothetical protein [Neoroseomonas alba]
MASISLRKAYAYDFLEETEVSELINIIDEFLNLLENRQTDDLDFCRQAMIDGLIEFKFRLEKLKWLDHGYAVESLRNVVAAYFVAKETIRQSPDFDEKSIMREIEMNFIKIFKILKIGKDAVDITRMIITGAVSLYLLTQNAPRIAGYLTYSPTNP